MFEPIVNAVADGSGTNVPPKRAVDGLSAHGRARRFAPALFAAVVVLAVGCSEDDGNGAGGLPAVDVSSVVRRDIAAGNGVPQAAAGDSLSEDYLEDEFLIEGVAATYSGPSTGPVVKVSDGVRYVTRVLVRYPRDPVRFSGRVVLEPFNTSSFSDRGVVWLQTASLLQDSGDAWVGVTARYSSDEALKDFDPVRYGQISIPTNDVEWDMLRQIGAVVKRGGSQSPLPDMTPRYLYMAGYSQSGLDTATFAMAFSPLTGTQHGSPVYDGYLPAAHSGSVTPVASGPTLVPPAFEHVVMAPVAVPVIDIESQSDVEGFSVSVFTSPSGAAFRREDSDEPGDLYRLYEIAGAAHAQRNVSCEGNGSSFPTYRFVKAALANLFRWAEDGVAPPRADRMETASIGTVSEMAVDGDGNALGGVRSPFIDVALVRFIVSSRPGPFCAFVGDEVPLSPDLLRERYGDVAGYMDEFEASLDATIADGFLLEDDRDDILAAQEERAEAAFD